jgi:phosphotransferase system  glucose/maltose/N-acetylglucosamine-specific IIC component
MNEHLGKTIILMGVVLIVVGALFMLIGKGGLPKLPGDIYIKKDNFVFYFPWVTSIVVSAVLSFIFYLFFRK